MKRNYFSILFFIKKTKLLKNGEAPICLRITVNGKRAEIQVKRSVEIKKWNSARECAIGKDNRTLELNHYLETVRTKVLKIHRELEQDNKTVTAEILKQQYYGENEPPKMLLEIFKEHNQKCRTLIGKDYVKETVSHYERTARYLSEFIKKNYHLSDIPIKEIDYTFIQNFEYFIKTEKSCQQNATIKYLKNLKHLVKIALVNQWIKTNPFAEIHFKQTPSNRDFLLEEELQVILKKQFKIPRLETVKDIFTFCCFTGLAFTDVRHLTPDHILCDNKGEYWIRKPREKTNNMCNVPLLEIPLKLIEKYRHHPDCEKKNIVFPVPTNQKMNAYLKEIADLCGIKKNLTTHMARHSFACLALANKVSLECIAKMLGHSNIKTTTIYAKVLDRTISEQMQALKQKFTEEKYSA